MKRRIMSVLLGITCILCCAGCASSTKNAPKEEEAKVEESKSEELKLNEVSLVSTSTAICEILDLLDYDNVVGIPETSGTIPKRYEGIATVGQPMGPDLEIIKSLQPDLVLSPISLQDSLKEQYDAAGISAEFLNLSSVQGMYDSIDRLGILLGREAEAESLREDYETYLEEYTSSSVEESECMVLMCFPSGYYLIATEKSYVGNLVELAGGNNVYSNYQGDQNGFISINPEDMIKRNPDKIFVFAHYGEKEAFEQMKKKFETDETWKFYDAVQDGEVYYLSSELFGMSATMDWKDSLEALKPMLYEE